MLIEELYLRFLSSNGVCTDTRKLSAGNLFFALKGPNFDANHFVSKALSKGASFVVAEQSELVNDKVMIVNDSLLTLQQLANQHRKKLKAKVIAIGGSNGKTTTKELINRVLSSSFKIYSTQGNLNNHIGVPLTLLSIPSDAEFAVLELGANHLGETKLLCEIAEPDFGLITNNGKDHLEGYGSIENVRKGNGELYDFLRSRKGKIFVCCNQEDLMKLSEGMNRVTYGEDGNADCSGKLESLFPYLKISVLGTVIKTQLIGRYNFENVMAAVCMGNYFNVPTEKIKAAIESYVPDANRSQLIVRGTNTFILDAYNANPSSMNAAIENFILLPAKKKAVILGDMLELGTSSESEHRLLLNKVMNGGFQKILLTGKEFSQVLGNYRNQVDYFNDVEELKKWFWQQDFEDFYFLIKGSRLMRLEKLLE